MAELVLLRHGRTDWNQERRIQGQSDSRLDERGHAQAAAVAPVMAALRPALLWSSDSLRARETASYVSSACGLEPTYDARLREYFLGPREGTLHQDYEADDPEEFAEFLRGNYDVVAGAEKSVDVASRMSEVIAEAFVVLRGSHGTGVLVSHGSAIRTAVSSLLGWDRQAVRGLSNCGWVVLEERDGPGDLWLRAYNRVVTTLGA